MCMFATLNILFVIMLTLLYFANAMIIDEAFLLKNYKMLLQKALKYKPAMYSNLDYFS